MPRGDNKEIKFEGFSKPQENWTKLPNELIDWIPLMSGSELKVVLYIIRHTWGYGQEDRRISLDEFENGRKYKDGTRMDKGTGLSIMTIRASLKEAENNGFIISERDETDRARIKIWYSIRLLKISIQTAKNLHPDCEKLAVDHRKIIQKDIIERNKTISDEKPVAVLEDETSPIDLSRKRAQSRKHLPNPAIQRCIDYFQSECLKHRKFKAEITEGKDHSIIKTQLKRRDESMLCDVMLFFVSSKECAWKTATIAHALSTDTINTYLEYKANGSKSKASSTSNDFAPKPRPGMYANLGKRV